MAPGTEGLGLVEVVVVVVVLVVVAMLVSLDRLAGRAVVHHHGGQLPHLVPPHHSAAQGQRPLQAPAPLLALLGSVLVLLVAEGGQGGEEGRAGSQVGRRGRRGDSGSQRGFASCPSGPVAHTHTLALGLGGSHKELAPVLGAPEPLLGFGDLGEWGVGAVGGAWVSAWGLSVWGVDGFWLVRARPCGVGGAGVQFRLLGRRRGA